MDLPGGAPTSEPGFGEQPDDDDDDDWEELLPARFLRKLQRTHSWKEKLELFRKILAGQQVD